jgi:hypothetical protein
VLEKLKLRPFKKQEYALSSPCDELALLGSRGGGKTFYLIWDFFKDTIKWGLLWNGILFRRGMKEQEEVIRKARLALSGTGARWVRSRSTFEFPGGSELVLAFIKRDEDAMAYQGHEYPWIGFDEITNWEDNVLYETMKGCNRAPGAPGIPCRMRVTGNPGGPGHGWVQEYFVDVADPYEVYRSEEGLTRVYVPSYLEDNPLYMKNNPKYVKQLDSLKHTRPALYKAWRLGQFVPPQGNAFPSLTELTHGIEWEDCPEEIRHPATSIDTFLDWGSGHPTCNYYFREDYEGIIYVFAEYYSVLKGKTGKVRPNKGTKLTAGEQVPRIKSFEKQRGLKPGLKLCDSSIYDKRQVVDRKKPRPKSIGTLFKEAGLTFNEVISKVIKQASREARLEIFYEYLRIKENGKPSIYFVLYDKKSGMGCPNLWRTIPALELDKVYIDQLVRDNKNIENHAYDCVSCYLAWKSTHKKKEKQVVPFMSSDFIDQMDSINMSSSRSIKSIC